MSRREQWVAVVVVSCALLLHALIPRYELSIRDTGIFRWDRWTGQVEAAPTLAKAPWATVTN